MRAIVPFRRGDDDRLIAARFVVGHLKGAGLRVVVVEQGDTPTALGADRHLLVARGPSMHRARCLNHGVLADDSNDEELLFADSDVVCEAAALQQSSSALSTFSAVSPYDRLFDLSHAETSNVTNGEKPSVLSSPRPFLNVAGGCVAMRVDAWRAVGGWDEEIAGWGAEDDCMAYKLEALALTSTSLRHDAFHLWHRPASVYADEYRSNLDFLDRLRAKSGDELREYIKGKHSIGRPSSAIIARR